MKKRQLTTALHLCSSLLLPALLLTAGAAQAQDTYWGLAGNKSFNTQTQAITTITGTTSALEAINPGARCIFDASGNVLFGVANQALYYQDEWTEIIPYNTARKEYGQVMPVPNQCRKFKVWRFRYGIAPNSLALEVCHLNMSTTSPDAPYPYADSVTTLEVAGYRSGAVAGALNADGSRYLYFMKLYGFPDIKFALSRYTINANGSVNPTPVVLSTTLPSDYVSGGDWPVVKMRLSQDGQTLAYLTNTNKLVTVPLLSSGVGTPTQYNEVAVGFEQATTSGGERRWYYTTGSAIRYVVEGIATSSLVNSTASYGKTDLALGRNGYLYGASGTPSAGTAGTLYRFLPGTTSISTVTGAQIAGLSADSSYYLFGNQVAGENINTASTTAMGSFTVSLNGDATNNTINMLDCLPMTLAHVSGTQGTWFKIVISKFISNAWSVVDNTGNVYGTFSSVDLQNLSSLSSQATNYLATQSSGTFKVEIFYGSSCASTSVSRQFTISAGPVATLAIEGEYQTKANNSPLTQVVTTPFGPYTDAPSATVPVNPLTVGRNNTIFTVAGGSTGDLCELEVHLDQAVSGAWVSDIVAPIIYSVSCSTWNPPPIFMSSFADENGDPYLTATTAPAGSIWRVRMAISNECGTLWRALPFKIGAKPTATAFGYLRERGETTLEETGVSFAPMPFGNKLGVVLSLEDASRVSLRIYSMDGRVIGTAANDQAYEAGTHTLDIETAAWPSGVYFYDCNIGGRRFSGKLIRQ